MTGSRVPDVYYTFLLGLLLVIVHVSQATLAAAKKESVRVGMQMV